MIIPAAVESDFHPVYLLEQRETHGEAAGHLATREQGKTARVDTRELKQTSPIIAMK